MDKAVDRKLQRRLEEDPILEAATDWFVELQAAGVPVERVLAWQQWFAADERHRAAYRSIESLWGAVDGVDSQLWPPPEAVSADRYEPDTSVSAWKARRTRNVLPYALAASVLLAVALGVSQVSTVRNWLAPSSISVRTHTAERREIRLSDGSMMTVGGRSSVSASLTGDKREIRLDAGEAFFDVAKDPKRPFIVHAGAAAVTAIGTQFNVRRVTDQVVVAVAEGVVQIDRMTDPAASPAIAAASIRAGHSGLRLVAGEQLSVPGNGVNQSLQTVDASAVGSWRVGKLLYLNEPLSAVVADVRRYADRDIEIADPAVGQLRITGTVFENDIESWLRTLESAFPLRATTDADGGIVIVSGP